MVISSDVKYFQSSCSFEPTRSLNFTSILNRGEFPLKTYLVYTVRSTAVNFKRHQNVIEKHTLPIDYDDGNTYEEPSESPQEILEREEQQRQFAAIWDQIPRADAELLYRKYILQESDEKLAEIYHCKKESIRMKLTRAKRKVISLMKGGDHS